VLSPSFDLKQFARKARDLGIKEIMDSLMAEMSEVNALIRKSLPDEEEVLAQQYVSDLEPLLRLFFGTELEADVRDGFVEDSWALLTRLSGELTVLTPEYMDSLRSKVDEFLTSGDFLGLVFDRTEVETRNIWTALRILNRLTEEPWLSKFRGRVALSISGYYDDPRELFEIEDVRRWVALLDRRFPYWLYFLTRVGSPLFFITECLCDTKREGDGVRLEPESLGRFLVRGFDAVNQLGIPEGVNEEITADVALYFKTRGLLA